VFVGGGSELGEGVGTGVGAGVGQRWSWRCWEVWKCFVGWSDSSLENRVEPGRHRG
jgi:hypothetical protein